MPPSTPSHRTALITGAARRIGRVIAAGLARDGWNIAVHYRNSKDEAAQLVSELRAMGVQSQSFHASLDKFDEMRSLVANVALVMGPPLCLINNASEFLPDSPKTVDETTWDKHIDINLKAPVFLAQAMFDQLPKGQDGNIINIIDQRVWKLTPEFFSYTISKAGLWTATRTLAQALAPRIRVNAIAPGPVFRSIHQDDETFRAEQVSTLLGRGPTPEEIAAAVRFILSASSMTGQMIALDGGQHLC